MASIALDRECLVEVLREALIRPPGVLVTWERGSAAGDGPDEWSDMDILVLVEDDFVEAAFDVLEQALSAEPALAGATSCPGPRGTATASGATG